MTYHLTALSELQSTLAGWRGEGARIALVPTMGALHAGHMALVKAAQDHADKVVVSVFVNPTQFGPSEDFSRYPRPLANDLALLKDAGVDAAWVPDVSTMYPQGFATSIEVGGISAVLDGAARPGHFNGVATVVAKLLNQVMPHVALFGEKDYQQLCMIRQLVRDLNMPTTILGIETQREADGLAMSSRNQYLSDEERKIAPQLHAALRDAAARLRNSTDVATVLAHATASIAAAGFHAIDYVALCHAQDLSPLSRYISPARLLVAAKLGTTRLIDNIEV